MAQMFVSALLQDFFSHTFYIYLEYNYSNSYNILVYFACNISL